MEFITEIDVIANGNSLPRILGNRIIRFIPQQPINDSYTTNHSVKYVRSGYEEYAIQGRSERLNGGDTMLVNAERRVTAESLGDAFAIFMEDELIDEIAAVLFNGASQGSVIHKNHTQRVVSKDFAMIWAKILANPDVVLTEEFFYETGAMYITSFITDRDISARLQYKHDLTARAVKEQLQKARLFIFEHVESNISLSDVAGQAAMSRFNLIRQFKQLYGFTPIRLHTWLRLNRAKALIRQQHLSLTEIAHKLDYPDLFTFSKQFKRLTGRSPSHFQL
ncbi:MAG: helix-turn-helix transcriptional regulator [Sinomicrobium sp.]|nr:helix-turn-helix transcriptional regulator [Sinomicrobium sp.]